MREVEPPVRPLDEGHSNDEVDGVVDPGVDGTEIDDDAWRRRECDAADGAGGEFRFQDFEFGADGVVAARGVADGDEVGVAFRPVTVEDRPAGAGVPASSDTDIVEGRGHERQPESMRAEAVDVGI